MTQERNGGLAPLTARSLMLSLMLGMHPPRLAPAELVGWCALFGVDDGTARTALSRMVRRGEVERSGGAYALAGRVLERQRLQDLALRPVPSDWDGQWLVAVVTAGDRSARARAALRAEFAAARFAEQREGVWTRPANEPQVAGVEQHTQCDTWTARPDGDPARLAASLWDLDAWARGARQATKALERSIATLRSGRAGAIPAAFYAGAGALRCVRGDPRLPPGLLAPTWPGDALRAAYLEYQPRFAEAVRGWRSAS